MLSKSVSIDMAGYEPATERGKNYELQPMWLRMWKHPLLKPYNRLAVAVLALNLYEAYSLNLGSAVFSDIRATVLNIILINFGVGIFIRQEWVINILFGIATSAPKSWPLRVRWALGKVYHFGGIHIGGFIAGSIWFFYYSYMVTFSDVSYGLLSTVEKMVLVANSFNLIAIMAVSLPTFRFPYHNTFEVVARFGNWFSLLSFWILFAIGVSQNSSLAVLAKDVAMHPHFWALVYLTYAVALPWLELKKVPVNTTSQSNHVAIADFDYGVTPFAGSSTVLSTNPLFEWHAFANIPSPNKPGFRLAISRAGDWTGQFIEDQPKHIWVKGIPAAGVGNVEKLFKRVVWVATGSGVGPCLPHLLSKQIPGRLVWSTRDPEKTYGNELVDEILDCEPGAVIWNTSEKGKPDLVELALNAVKEFDAEAVICISNKKLTFHLNQALESRGIPAFGAIWDS